MDINDDKVYNQIMEVLEKTERLKNNNKESEIMSDSESMIKDYLKALNKGAFTYKLKKVNKNKDYLEYVLEIENCPKKLSSLYGKDVYLYQNREHAYRNDKVFSMLPFLYKSFDYEKDKQNDNLNTKFGQISDFLNKELYSRIELINDMNQNYNFYTYPKLKAVLNEVLNLNKMNGFELKDSIVTVDDFDSEDVVDGSVHHHFEVEGVDRDIKVRISQNFDKKKGAYFVSSDIKTKGKTEETYQKVNDELELFWEEISIKKFKDNAGLETLRNFLDSKMLDFVKSTGWVPSKSGKKEKSKEETYLENLTGKINDLISQFGEPLEQVGFSVPDNLDMSTKELFTLEKELVNWVEIVYDDLKFKNDTLHEILVTYQSLKEFSPEENVLKTIAQTDVNEFTLLIEKIMDQYKEFSDYYHKILEVQHKVSGKILVAKVTNSIKEQKENYSGILSKLEKLA